jgi:hypothetical protein
LVQEKTYKWIQARLREIDSGVLSEKDLARLKEIAREDPFVADALEGFHAHPDAGHNHHLVAIEEKIKVQKRARRRWLVPNLAVTAIAACFLLLIGAYAVIMRMDNASEEKLFVFVAPDSILTMDTVSEAIAMESNLSTEDVSEDTSSQLKQEVHAHRDDQTLASSPDQTSKNTARSSGRKTGDKPVIAMKGTKVDAVIPQEKESMNRAAPEALAMHHIEGKIVDAATNEALAFSPYLLGHTNKLSFTDANGRFGFDAAEKFVVINLKHAGYEERTLAISAVDKDLQLKLIPSDLAKKEEALQGLSSDIDNIASAYFAFRNYIDTASQITLGTGISSNGKIVTVAFTVGSNGRPGDFSVNDTSTGDKKHIKEALRLIDSGPDWDCLGGQYPCRRNYTFYFQ